MTARPSRPPGPRPVWPGRHSRGGEQDGREAQSREQPRGRDGRPGRGVRRRRRAAGWSPGRPRCAPGPGGRANTASPPPAQGARSPAVGQRHAGHRHERRHRPGTGNATGVAVEGGPGDEGEDEGDGVEPGRAHRRGGGEEHASDALTPSACSARRASDGRGSSTRRVRRSTRARGRGPSPAAEATGSAPAPGSGRSGPGAAPRTPRHGPASPATHRRSSSSSTCQRRGSRHARPPARSSRRCAFARCSRVFTVFSGREQRAAPWW